MLLTRAPLYLHPEGYFLVRLACVKHTASVRSEPGSNSPVKLKIFLLKSFDKLDNYLLFSFQRAENRIVILSPLSGIVKEPSRAP